MKIYVVTYETESGDSGVLGAFEHNPTKAEIDALGREKQSHEYEVYDGEEVVTIYYKTVKTELLK